MTSRQRVRSALQRSKADRLPMDFACVPEVWNTLLPYLGCASQDDALDALDIDIRFVAPTYVGPPLKSYLSDGKEIHDSFWGYRYTWQWNGMQNDHIVVERPLDSATTVEEMLDHSWPDPDWFDYDSVRTQCERYPDRAILIGDAGAWQFATFLRDQATIMMDMAIAPELVTALFDRMVDFELEYYERIFQAAGGAIDILRTFDDYGSQVAPLFSPDMWRQYCAENTRRLTELAHRHEAFFMQHSCGAIEPLIEGLIDVGVDALDPLQPVPGMEPEILAEKYADRITFHGGIDTQDLLPNGTPSEVAEEVRRLAAIFERTGGYILAGSQFFQADTPPQNIVALYEAGREIHLE